MLEAGEVEVALAPVAAVIGRPGLRVVPGVCIGAEGPVSSVLLAAETPPEEWTAVRLDGVSRTSVVLAELLLRKGPLASRVRPDLAIVHVPAADGSSGAGGTVAALVIGDNARTLDPRWTVRIDLAGQWTDWTGLPFVFAVWAARRTAPPGPVRAVHASLVASRDWGLAHLDVLAEASARASGVSVAACREYFAGLDYAFTNTHLAGLTDFFRRLAADGLVPEGTLQFLQVA